MAVDGVESNCLEALGGTCDADYECTYVAPTPAGSGGQTSGSTAATVAASALAALAAANL